MCIGFVAVAVIAAAFAVLIVIVRCGVQGAFFTIGPKDLLWVEFVSLFGLGTLLLQLLLLLLTMLFTLDCLLLLLSAVWARQAVLSLLLSVLLLMSAGWAARDGNGTRRRLRTSNACSSQQHVTRRHRRRIFSSDSCNTTRFVQCTWQTADSIQSCMVCCHRPFCYHRLLYCLDYSPDAVTFIFAIILVSQDSCLVLWSALLFTN